jgi:hypothetical protein
VITYIPKFVDRGLDKLSKIIAIFEQSAPLIAKKQQDKDNQDLKNKRFSG